MKRALCTAAQDSVLFSRSGTAQVFCLNRPKALNALNRDMIGLLSPQVHEWNVADDVKVVVSKGAGEKSYCAGGDIVSLCRGGESPEGRTAQQDFFHSEYQLDYALARMRAPHVALWNGIVMGGGVGVSINARFRVACEKTVFAMPETGIGFFPDVGGTYFLPKLPGATGMYLALTGARLKGYQLVKAGLATHFVPQAQFAELEAALGKVSTGDVEEVEAVLSTFAVVDEEARPSELETQRESIDACFGLESVEDVLHALEQLELKGDKWAGGVFATMMGHSPTALKVTHQQMSVGKRLEPSLEQVFTMEARLAANFMRGVDFYEGVHSKLIAKSNEAAWKPHDVRVVDDEDVAQYFTLPADAEELTITSQPESVNGFRA
jgi:enoyl-CoA hydratase/carnithine racemase